MAAATLDPRTGAGSTRDPPRIRVVVLGMSLGVSFAISFVVCVLFYLAIPDIGSGHAILTLLLPYFKFHSWLGFVIGLVESFVLGWYVAIVFGPTYNLCSRWLGKS
jgi:hypothetical protein